MVSFSNLRPFGPRRATATRRAGGSYVLYRVGDRDRWESVIAGEPLQQITVAEPCASAGMTACSPEVWPRLERKGYKGKKAPQNLECRAVWKSKFYGAVALNLRVDLDAIDATPARRRGGAGSSPLDRISTAACAPDALVDFHTGVA